MTPGERRDRRLSRAVTIAVLVASVGVYVPVAMLTPALFAGPSVVPVAPAFAPIPRPEPSGDLDIACESLVSDDQYATVAGAEISFELASTVTADFWSMPDFAVRRDGGISCDWLTGEDVNGWRDWAVSLAAIPDAVADFERFARLAMSTGDSSAPYLKGEDFDGLFVRCENSWNGTGHSCQWNILSADIWMQVDLYGVADSDVLQFTDSAGARTTTPAIAGSKSLELVTAIVEDLVHADRREPGSDPAALPTCALLLKDVVDGDESISENGPPDLPVAYVGEPLPGYGVPVGLRLPAFSYERLGVRDCSLRGTGISGGVHVVVARGLDAMLRPGAQRDAESEVDGLGTVYDGCTEEHWAYESCTTLISAGDLVIGVEASSEEALPIARAVLASVNR